MTIYARPLGWTVAGDPLFCAHEIGWRLRAVTIKEIAAFGALFVLAVLTPAALAFALSDPRTPNECMASAGGFDEMFLPVLSDECRALR